MHGPEQVTELLDANKMNSGRLYDASCGEGSSSNLLKAMGFEVVCSTFRDKPTVDSDIEWVEGVDLNRSLPFDDQTFDCAVLQEVIEHLENPAHVIREFNRILKLGGRWVLTTPNAACLRSRLHFLLSGFVKGRRRPANYNVPPGNYTNLFIPSFTTLHYLLWMYGFRVVATGRSKRKASSVILSVLLFPFVFLWTRYYTRPPKAYDSPKQHEACADFRRIVLTPHLLLDENLVLLLEKTDEIGDGYRPEDSEVAQSSASLASAL